MKFSIKASILFASALSNVLVVKTTAAATRSQVLKTTDTSVHPMQPNPEPYQVTYSDGTKSPWMRIKVRGALDSTHEIYEETLDGYTVKQLAKGGKYTYLDVDDTTGEMFDTGLIAGVDNPFQSNLHKEAALKSSAIKNRKKLFLEQNNHDNRKLRGNVERHRRTAITTGTLKNLVIPFKFSDHTARALPSKAQLDTLMNNVGPDSSVCPTGSVRDVYLINSFNQLDLQSTVIDWVTLDFTEAYCANGNSGLTTLIHSCLANALDKAVAAGVDFGDYDLDNDGFMDGITFFHSGYAAEWGGTDAYGTSNSDRIWSHKWSIYTQNWNNNGVRVYDYHINPAVWSTSGSNIGRIGVVAHETGHFLGLPDLYDYGDATYGEGNGIGSYGLMANSWGFDNSQYYPPLMSAWSKKKLGWVTPTTISTSGSYSLSQACDNNDMIMINAGYPSGEYLLIENRQPCGTEQAMTQGGLAIFHIDDNANNIRGYPDQTGWPTNGNHYEVALLQADGSYNLEKNNNRGDSNDLFHGGGVNAIGPNGISSGAANPNTKAYQNGNVIDTEVSISNISAAGGTMTFDITIGSSTSAPSSSPSRIPSMAPSSRPSAMPSMTPSTIPSTVPSNSPSTMPSTVPSNSPSTMPSTVPSNSPSTMPSVNPFGSPSSLPSSVPSSSPTTLSSESPSSSPSISPSNAPVRSSPTVSPIPSTSPSLTPSTTPSGSPSSTPSTSPSESPSKSPSVTPSGYPSSTPSKFPSGSPSEFPSRAPSTHPSTSPSIPPSTSPSVSPTMLPSENPSLSPTASPSLSLSSLPSLQPSRTVSTPPTTLHSVNPSLTPSASPTLNPSVSPTILPTLNPSVSPTTSPTENPTTSPTAPPTASPTTSVAPSVGPTSFPTSSPVISPTCNDSPLRFKVLGSTRDCAWAASDISLNCAIDGVSESCPSTCGTCDTCADSSLKFRIFLNGKFKFKNCKWVAKKKNRNCAISGVEDTCREVCGCSTQPTASPTANPVAAPSVSSPVTSPTCIDSPLRFKVLGSTRDCAWAASDIAVNCAIDGVSESCPSTCGTCDTCADSSLKFRIFLNGKFKFKNCKWVAKKKDRNCAISGVEDTCREVCETC